MRHDSTVTASSFAALALIAFAAQASDGRWVRVGDLSGDDIAETVWCDATADGGAGAVEVFDGAPGALIVRFTGDPGTCAEGTYAVQALGESLCIEVIATP